MDIQPVKNYFYIVLRDKFVAVTKGNQGKLAFILILLFLIPFIFISLVTKQYFVLIPCGVIIVFLYLFFVRHY